MKTAEGYERKQYIAAFLCVNCNEELTRTEVERNAGVCPRCGHISEDEWCAVTKIAKLVTTTYGEEADASDQDLLE